MLIILELTFKKIFKYIIMWDKFYDERHRDCLGIKEQGYLSPRRSAGVFWKKWCSHEDLKNKLGLTRQRSAVGVKHFLGRKKTLAEGQEQRETQAILQGRCLVREGLCEKWKSNEQF